MKRQLFVQSFQSKKGLMAIKTRKKIEFNSRFKSKI